MEPSYWFYIEAQNNLVRFCKMTSLMLQDLCCHGYCDKLVVNVHGTAVDVKHNITQPYSCRTRQDLKF